MWLGIAIVTWLILVCIVLLVWSRHWRHVRWHEGIDHEGIDEEAYVEGRDDDVGGREDDPRGDQRIDPLIVLRVEPANDSAGGYRRRSGISISS